MTRHFRSNGTRPVFVLDVSVAATWLLTSLGSAYTSGVLGRMLHEVAAVPAN